jgi:hypothetical protein
VLVWLDGGWGVDALVRITLALLAAGVRSRGSERRGRLEGYPVDSAKGSRQDREPFMGVVSMFERAAFSEIARRPPARPIVRLELHPGRHAVEASPSS